MRMGGINGGGLGTRLLLFLVLETPCNYARGWHISNTSSNQNIVQTHQCIGHYRFTLKHKNDTITILLHVNVSKQVESKLEIQEAPLTCTELNAEALGFQCMWKTCVHERYYNCDTQQFKGCGPRSRNRSTTYRLVLSEANLTTVQPAVCDLQPALSHGCQTHSLGSKSPWIL